MNDLLPPCDTDKIVSDPETFFSTHRPGWFAIWYKVPSDWKAVAPKWTWAKLRCVGSIALHSYRRLIKAGRVRNILIEAIPDFTPGYRANTSYRENSLFDPRYFQRRGF